MGIVLREKQLTWLVTNETFRSIGDLAPTIQIS